MSVRSEVMELVKDTICRLGWEISDIDLSNPPAHVSADFATNAAILEGARRKKNPRLLAQEIIDALAGHPLAEALPPEGPGFVNIRVKPQRWEREIRRIVEEGAQCSVSTPGKGKAVLIEYVSSNPTGPLHVGHGRSAALGETLSQILTTLGYRVTREYYINDCGKQIELLGKSLAARVQQARGKEAQLPEGGYRGEYLSDIAGLLAEDGKERDDKELERYAVSRIMEDTAQDLERFNVHFDEWKKESDFYSGQQVAQVFAELSRRKALYEKDGALWFRSSLFGDSQDHVLVRENGMNTYLASDIAYHADKFRRGFDMLVDIWGADHHGYAPRLKAAMRCLGLPADKLFILIYQLVSLSRSGHAVSMSTRQGEFVTLREVVEEVGSDACRFFFLMRHANSHLEFDLELAKKETPENPVFYIQYAFARIQSVLRKLAAGDFTPLAAQDACGEYAARYATVKELARYPDILELCAARLEPHHLALYLLNLAGLFHQYYDSHRFLVNEEAVRTQRLTMMRAVSAVLKDGLTILGVSAPNSM